VEKIFVVFKQADAFFPVKGKGNGVELWRESGQQKRKQRLKNEKSKKYIYKNIFFQHI
jgi:hypothetical protein